MLIIEGNKLCTYPRCQNHLTKRCHFYLTMTLDCKWVGTIIKFEYNYKSDIDLNEVIDDIEYIPYSKLLEDMKENRDFIDGYLGISN